MKRSIQTLIVMIAMLSLQSFTTDLSSGSTTVYIVDTGKVYHSTKSCRGLANTTHKIKAISLKEAQKTRRPCKICY